MTELAILFFLLVSRLTFLPSSAMAEEAGSPLTWQNCERVALKQNPELAASQDAYAASRASYYGSFNGFLPQLSLSNSYRDANQADNASRWQTQGSASLSLWNASRVADIKSASAALSLAQASVRQASAAARFDLRKAFARLVFAQNNVGVSETIYQLREKNARSVTLRYESGRESKGNMLKAKAQLLQAEANLAQAGRDLKVARIALWWQMGAGPDFDVFVASGTLEVEALGDYSRDISVLVSQRPDVASRQAAIEAAEAGLSQSRSVLWPSLSASYTRSVAGSTEFPSSRYGWTLGGILSYPLFGGGPTAAYFSVSAANKNLDKARQDFRSAGDQARVELESAQSDLAGALDQIKVQSALLEAARQRNDEADIRYASGLLSFDNWELIASDRVGAERQAVEAKLNAVVAEASWQKALGKGLEE